MPTHKNFTKSKFRKVLVWLIVLSMHATFVLPSLLNRRTAWAAKISDGTWAQSGSPGTTTITFTTPSQLEVGEDIVLSFPSSATVDGTGTDIAVTGQTTPTRSNNAVDNTITITLDTQIVATTAITITMTDGLSAYTSSNYAQESVGINTNESDDTPIDYGLGIITNTNTTTVTATVPLFVNMEIDTTTINLGTLSTASVAGSGGSIDQTYTFDSNNQTGITVQILADGDLDDGSGNTINDVADGTVTAGSEEYGISVDNVSSVTIDASYNTGDNPIAQVADDIATSAGAVDNATFDVNYKASIAGTTVAGSYNQVVTMTVTTNS